MCCLRDARRQPCSNTCEVRDCIALVPSTARPQRHPAPRPRPPPHQTLVPPPAAELGHTGAKLGCGEGGCGACTVMVSTHLADGQLRHRSINACLCPLYAVEGAHVVTVEGIGNARDGLHPVQERLAKAHGSQCGFCTPGFVMSMYALLRSKTGGPPTEEEIEENLAGNLWCARPPAASPKGGRRASLPPRPAALRRLDASGWRWSRRRERRARCCPAASALGSAPAGC